MTEPVNVYHDVDLSTGGHGRDLPHYAAHSETITLEYSATWRGRPVVVSVNADRYVHSSGWSEWRIYAKQAREDVGPAGGLGADLTETARHRLNDEFKPFVGEWLQSKAYGPSASRAYVYAVKNVGSRLRYSSRDLRDAIEANVHRLPPQTEQDLRRVADAFDAYIGALDAVKP